MVNTSYNRFAGGSVERIAALSDGIFGVAMTLLLLDLHIPAHEAIHSDADLAHALLALAPQLAVYLMSFLTLGFSGSASSRSSIGSNAPIAISHGSISHSFFASQ